MDLNQNKNTDNNIESLSKWIIAKGIQSLLNDNLEALKTCKPREKRYLQAKNEAYQKSLDVIKKYIVDRFDSDFLTSS